MEIEPYQERGLRLRWNNVTLVDGRRDVPGVQFRHATRCCWSPAPGRSFFLAGIGYDPFAEKKHEPDPIAGDPLRWGWCRRGPGRTYSFSILDDGTYELQMSQPPSDAGRHAAASSSGSSTARWSGT